MEDQNSGLTVNQQSEKVTGAKIWNSLCRYFYQKISPSQLLAITIIIGLCANDQDAVEAYTVLDPQNDYMPGSADPNPTDEGDDGNKKLLTDPVTESEIAKEILIYLHENVPSEDILTLLKTTRWGKNNAGPIGDFIQMYQPNDADHPSRARPWFPELTKY